MDKITNLQLGIQQELEETIKLIDACFKKNSINAELQSLVDQHNKNRVLIDEIEKDTLGLIDDEYYYQKLDSFLKENIELVNKIKEKSKKLENEIEDLYKYSEHRI